MDHTDELAAELAGGEQLNAKLGAAGRKAFGSETLAIFRALLCDRQGVTSFVGPSGARTLPLILLSLS